MDFDEYDYLEKTVENPEVLKVKENANGGEENLKSSGEKDWGRSGRRRSDENEYDEDHRRSKLGERSCDNDQHGSTRHRSRSRDGERNRHKSIREHKDRERDSERDERNRRERERDRGKEREHGRDRDRRDSERGRERERDRERLHQSRSRTTRHEGNRDENERERSQDKDRKEEDRERELRGRERESRGYKDRKEEAKEPEADPERDQRTVFAYQLALKADERDVYEFFSRAGKVRDVRLIMDRNSRRSKGVGYVEFYDAMSVPMAIALSGQPLLGLPVMVKPSEAEKNLVQSNTSTAGGATGSIGPYSGGARRLYVGNLHSNLTSDQLKKIFEPFGDVELVQLPLDGAGQCKGFGFVQFTRLEDAQNAQSLNGLEIAGRTIKVSAVTNEAEAQDVGPVAGDFDDDEGGGLSLNASSRAMLMQKLAGSNGSSFPGSVGTPSGNNTEAALSVGPTISAASAASSVAALMEPLVTGIPPAGSLINSIGTPSECLLLKNMFDPKLETELDFDLDIKEDVEDEASKFGNLKHIYVDRNSAGFVYLRFEKTQSAVNAQRALHGRWFAGKMITATFVVPQNYEAKFPESQ